MRREEAGRGGVFVALAATTCRTTSIALRVAVPWAGPQGEVGGQVIALHVGKEHTVLVLQLHHLRKHKRWRVTTSDFYFMRKDFKIQVFCQTGIMALLVFGWTAMKFVTDIHVPQRIILTDFGDPLTFQLAPLQG